MSDLNGNLTENLKRELDEGWKPEKEEFFSKFAQIVETVNKKGKNLLEDARRILTLKLTAYIEPIKADCTNRIDMAESTFAEIRDEIAQNANLLSGLISQKNDGIKQALFAAPPRFTKFTNPIAWVVVVIASGAILFDTSRFVNVGMNVLGSVMPAILALCPSVIVTSLLYHWGDSDRKGRERREKLESHVQRLFIVALYSFCSMMIFYLISKFCGLLGTGSSFTAQNMFATGGISTTQIINATQKVTAFIALVSAFACEVGFSTSLSVVLYRHLRRHTPKKRLNEEIYDLKSEIKQLKAQEKATNDEVRHYRILRDSVVDNWAADELETMLWECEAMISARHLKARQKFNHHLGELPIYELEALISNGNPTNPDYSEEE